MLIKICGITDPETARFAAEKGANYIGILFSKVSPRAVSLEVAKQIAAAVRKAGAEPVGVFADESLEEILKIVQALDLKIVQLHGDVPRKAAPFLSVQKIYVADGKSLPDCLDPKRDFLLFERVPIQTREFRFFIAGGLNPENVSSRIASDCPDGVDASSGLEKEIAQKDLKKIERFAQSSRLGYYGSFGGMFVPELLAAPLFELAQAFEKIVKTQAFEEEFLSLLHHYVGRPTALTEVLRFAKSIGSDVRIFLKREDLTHTGAHKINNAIGQCLLAKQMGKKRVIAETGAGQHGVATATAAALLGLECVIFMGKIDIERQAPNVAKMQLLGAQVIATEGTLKDAVNEALRDWAKTYETTHYCLGSALGPHPFPTMVAHFQEIIGKEAKEQLRNRVGRDPDYAIACVGGGSNAIGLFSAYLDNPNVQLIGVEAGGRGKGLGNHAARFFEGSPGILHGTHTFVLQNEGQIVDTHSISAGLDYPAVGPQHAAMHLSGRARYELCTDEEALAAFELLSRTEGIIPALESAHALGYLMSIAKTLEKGAIVLINLSGRGDKDLPKLFEKELAHVAHR